MSMNNPLTAKEKLKAARASANCRYGCLAWSGDYGDHETTASALLEGLSVHEVTMAEIELDYEEAFK